MHDIAIIGGGLVGLSAALTLQHPARRIALIEAADHAKTAVGSNPARTLALSASSVQIFRALGLWSSIKTGATPIRHIHVSARGRWGVTRLRASDYELDALGYVIESQTLGQRLLAAVKESTLIELQDRAEFDSIDSNQCVEIGYRRGNKKRQLQARLVLIADGAQSRARDKLGIEQQLVDYGQSVVICNVDVDDAQIATAYERFTPDGPLAMLPLGRNRYACVWTLTPERAAQACAQSDADFCTELQDCFGYRLGMIESVSKRIAAPICRSRAATLYIDRCVIVGNAANSLHPVAGQGFNLALRDVACLYERLLDQTLAELDESAITTITGRYAKARESEHRQVISYGDGLVSLFSNRLPVFDQLRAAGLGLFDLVPILKTHAALAGMGLSFGGNRLLRGHL